MFIFSHMIKIQDCQMQCPILPHNIRTSEIALDVNSYSITTFMRLFRIKRYDPLSLSILSVAAKDLSHIVSFEKQLTWL